MDIVENAHKELKSYENNIKTKLVRNGEGRNENSIYQLNNAPNGDNQSTQR